MHGFTSDDLEKWCRKLFNLSPEEAPTPRMMEIALAALSEVPERSEWAYVEFRKMVYAD